MHMKLLTCLVLLVMISIGFTSFFTAPVLAVTVPTVGVKEGDWIEYDVAVTGTGVPPPTHDVRWFKIEVLQVQEDAFSVNLTARYANGTMGSAIWEFNFTEGNVGGWIIIPANLDVGESFFDASIHNDKPVNVTIQSQEQKTVLGASRTITCGNDSFRHKEWDKLTGVFVGSSETYRNVTSKDGWHIDDLTVTVNAVATNIWSPDAQAAGQSMFYPAVGAVIAAVAVFSLVVVVARRRHITLSPKQQTIIALTLVLGLVLAVGVISAIPLSESQVPLSFRDINMVMQSLWLGLLLLGMWFRKKGNYLLHGVLVTVVVVVTIMGFVGVLFMSPMGEGSMDGYFNSPVDVVVFLAHAVFSLPALAFGVWFVALWRPSSAAFPVKSRRVVWLLAVFWVLSYVVGVLDYLLLRIDLFG